MDLNHPAKIDQTTSSRFRIMRVIKLLLLAIVLIGLTGWGSLAIFYGDSAESLLQTILSIAFGVAGFAAVISLFILRWRLPLVGGFLLLFVVVLVWWFNISPSNERVWRQEEARSPFAKIEGDIVTIHNVRNFTYRTETDFTPAYYSKSYDLSKLNGIDLFAVYWMGPAIAHTIISFDFGGQDHLAISIEARKEQGEGYSTIKGFFRQYELIYIVADERDLIRLRTDYRDDPPEEVYLYRLQSTPENARKFFMEYVKNINEINDQPRFYNTLLANCTNVIWMHGHVNPGRVPFSWKILASGYLPEYLYEKGRLDTSVSFAELNKRGHVNPIAKQLGNTADFSQRIRAGEASTSTAVSR